MKRAGRDNAIQPQLPQLEAQAKADATTECGNALNAQASGYACAGPCTVTLVNQQITATTQVSVTRTIWQRLFTRNFTYVITATANGSGLFACQ